ncbi:ribosomal protein S8e [Hamiltosporidium tvaerminnensis]|uniref:Ribosomal protein S8e n=2 Tax=Hamiltosporidium TaxID=1176354 RepID=A0A4V2JVR0_9MICR|nr:Ribosome biogenesis protein [Hamiltosporidium tvaerminnensis]TBU04725.1 ribosomal protein S8e [Hamiltosporidium magnivora]TBT97387.1 ribosomal protein S8e [Hamiltosporidium tvaerminnensis]TBU04962.1 ribosomal protein S8e [Hamiltosporidium magnivora]TBU11640.1 ribosomal protein S8e [Hamiltosporidium tvaerminnensis]
MGQNNFIEEFIKRHGRRLDYDSKNEKRIAREPHKISKLARKLHGHRAIMFHQSRRTQKIAIKKEICKKTKTVEPIETSAIPHFLLDRDIKESTNISKEKQKKSIKLRKYAVPIPKVKGISEAEVFSVMKSGKRRTNTYKRKVNKPCFVSDQFTRKPPKFERFIRPMALRFRKAHVTHPELKTTHTLPIIGIKQNPHSELFTSLGVLSKGSVIEVNVSELAMLSESGNIIWGKYAQITNHPENDGCVNAILLI